MRQLRYRPAARTDIRDILRASQRRFGVRAKRDYNALIDRALLLLRENPTRPGVVRPDRLVEGASLFHLRHARQRGHAPKAPRHLIVFVAHEEMISVVRVLHDAMDIEAQLGGEGGGE